ncbi:FMN-dependent NADH-azoreductase [Pectobacterium carotovorum]|uniref:FMN-dependent NADH-azoreductase n=1 Tax=Pectobacterium carotovorum TaxID=554 RepID=UPI00057F2D53|nr:FMN-dependent NADH-azoreductase [Pectobacterium carotovorum]KHT35387.1 FMN-dependent NADH-azoreductase [Pectobacterium carotovorum subsp. carotovorum]MBA0191538.1 FMN-dependent NADH-azoreductase [Pectobacterium carotovorum]MBA0198963.1 FMN-dependent NADH-azoreductase [Pectobacterium carotovorum]MCQ8233442.1 FMN-dependent NADH-azoreductase [Pectobacterium carotovorum]UFT93303.1 FMN-dependent NADH-azoreductase [Pectobacterium carotovorum]
MNILHIDSSILESGSVSRQISADVVEQLVNQHPQAVVTYRDVVKDEIRHLTGPIAAGFRQIASSSADEATLREHQLSEALVAEFLANDVIVIGAPMYNFSVSSQLKSWLDRLAQAGKTFKYTEKGPVGLSGGRTVIVVSSRGGFYTTPPFLDMDFQERYLQGFFRFLGITDIHFIRAEGASKGDEIKHREIQNAQSSIHSVVTSIA